MGARTCNTTRNPASSRSLLLLGAPCLLLLLLLLQREASGSTDGRGFLWVGLVIGLRWPRPPRASYGRALHVHVGELHEGEPSHTFLRTMTHS